MKKTSTRLASVGGLVVLGACAIALAQHDSRYRERPSIDTDSVLAKQTDPIEMDASWNRPIPGADRPSTTSGTVSGTSLKTERRSHLGGSQVTRAQFTDTAIVRANNDRSLVDSLTDHVVLKNEAGQSDENPLRGLATAEFSDGNHSPNSNARPSSLPSSASLSDLPSDLGATANAPKDALPAPGPMPSLEGHAGPPRIRASVASFSDSPNASTSQPAALPTSDSMQAQHLSSSKPSGSLSRLPAHQAAGGAGTEAHLASGEAPVDPPAWLQQRGAGSQLPNTPQLPNTSASGQSAGQNRMSAASNSTDSNSTLPPSLPSTAGSNALPAPPALGGASMNGSSTSSPAENTPTVNRSNGPTTSPFASERSNTPPQNRYPAPRSRVNDLSDTQRGVMQATDLTANQNGIDSVPSLPSARGSFDSNSNRNSSSGFGSSNPSLPSAGATSQGRPLSPGSASSGASVGGTSTANNGGFGGSSSSARPSSNSQLGKDAGRMSLATLVSNRPGNRFLDGSQNPVLQIQKRAPEEIQVGKKASFIIVVRNAGNAAAHGVTVLDSVPRGSKFVESIPSALPDNDGVLTWNLGQMRPGEERSIQLQIVPEVQGEVGSVATVHFAAQASVRTVATLPKLELVVQSPPDVLIGDVQELDVLVKNSGTGIARDVRLEADIPNQLQHQSGDSQLEANIGDLRPNETRRIKLSLSAVAPGASKCLVRAIAADNISDAKEASVDVRAPKLVAQIEGPKLRFLERQATYRVAVKNQGTAAATNCQFQVHLPAGLKFNASDANGHYDPAAHTVTWRLVELPAGRTAPMEVTVLPVELGPQVISFHATGDLEVEAEAKSQVVVDGLSELAFTIGQDDGTIEVGSTSTYSVQVTNVGNKSDKNVQLAVEMPAGATLVAVVNAPVEYRTSGNQIIFAPIAEMRNKDQHIFRFQVRHNEPGKQIVRTKLISANWPNPVVKEEGTLVYNDQD